METVPKREYKTGGIVKLPQNVSAAYSEVEQDILADVDPDDQTHMALVIDYCATRICNKNDPIKIFIHTSRHEKTGQTLLYTLFVGLPSNTEMDDSYTTGIKEISWRRITRGIKWKNDFDAGLVRLEICINPMRCMPEIDDVSIVNIHIKQNRHLNIIHEKNAADDDKRGSTKRPRREADTDK